MKIRTLGAGAGGGLPQWNCGCAGCAAARRGEIAAMSQSSVAVSADGCDWAVLNAAPDIRQQLCDTPALHPRALRGSPVKAVVLTNADVDHVAGLLTLREKTPFTLFATAEVLATLKADPIFAVLDPALVTMQPLTLDQAREVLPGLRVTPFAVPGKVALWLEKGAVKTDILGEQTIGLTIEQGGRRFDYVPGCATVPEDLKTRLAGADLLVFDGTVWDDAEMIQSGTGAKTGARMGHIAMSGAHGSLARLSDLPGRRIYIHINNTNPVLLPDSPERAQLLARGWTLAHDGMEIEL
ncbi:pyrroloquinoline quinone biosynthesis protein PqqB [Thioclava sp. BHET1]|nr:pyrroloquinoline quinone biosynthesis protein PqqB [Thioclava sp. BHET1]